MSRAEFFQADAAINQGNSGGPLFNMKGEVIGIVSHILSHSGGSEGLGFAVTSKVARQLLEQKSFWSGLGGFMLSGDMAQVFNPPPPGVGLLVQRVAAGSPAERMGLKAGTTRASIGDEEPGRRRRHHPGRHGDLPGRAERSDRDPAEDHRRAPE